MYKILSWYENLPSNEIPPAWMWALDWELEDWFLEIEFMRNGSKKDRDDREQVEMVDNEFSSRFRD